MVEHFGFWSMLLLFEVFLSLHLHQLEPTLDILSTCPRLCVAPCLRTCTPQTQYPSAAPLPSPDQPNQPSIRTPHHPLAPHHPLFPADLHACLLLHHWASVQQLIQLDRAGGHHPGESRATHLEALLKPEPPFRTAPMRLAFCPNPTLSSIEILTADPTSALPFHKP